MGVPVVAANVSGLPEIVESGVSGELVDARAPGPYVDALRRLCEDLPLRARTIAAGRAVVEKRFLRARNLEAHVDLYASLLDANRSRTRAT